MEGQTKPSNKLKLIESKKKLRVDNQIKLPHQKLIASANNHDLILIGSEDNYIKCVQTSRLLDFTATQAQVVNESASKLISLTFRPTLISVARHGFSSVLLICGTRSGFPNCPNIEAYDLDSKTTIGHLSLDDLTGSEIVDYAWHPNYFDSIVALCSSRGHLLVLAINRQDKGIGIVYKNEQYGALTCCWSPKGKNLAVGTVNGRVFRLEPIIGDNSFSFKEVDRSTLIFTNPKILPEHQVIKLRWINKNFLLAVHAKSNHPNGPDTVYSLITVKQSKPYLYWSNVCFENQPTSNYVVHLANLTNSVICASSAAGEAAVIGVIGANEAATNEMNDWSALIIEEEGARIELPLDANNQETHPCGLTLTTWPQDGRPILIFYTNDGLICPYVAMHADNILKLPEMQPAQTFKFDVVKTAPQTSLSFGSAFGAKPSFYQAPAFKSDAANIAPQTSLQLGSAFGSKPSFYQSPEFKSDAAKIAPQTSPALGSAFGAKPSFYQAPIFKSDATKITPQTPPAPGSTFDVKSPSEQTPSFKSDVAKIAPQTSPAFGSAFGAKPSFDQALSFKSDVAKIIPQTTPAFGSAFGAKPCSDQTPSFKSDVAKIAPQTPPALGLASEAKATFYQPPAFDIEIKQAREKFEFNKAYITLFDELNPLRDRFDEVLDLHKAHHDALEAIREDINRLDLEVLETYYLIEYLKSRRSCDIKKKTIDPVTMKKVNSFQLKLKGIGTKLNELNNHVDVAWEDFVRRNTNKDNRHVSSLDIIYKSLATNQKIINALKKKVEFVPESSASSIGSAQIKPKEDQAHKRFEEFLAARCVVPVRRPINQKI